MSCLICLESTTYQVKENCNNSCKYYVHKECIQTWIDKEEKCIICKQKMNTKIGFDPKRLRRQVHTTINYIMVFFTVYVIFEMVNSMYIEIQDIYW